MEVAITIFFTSGSQLQVLPLSVFTEYGYPSIYPLAIVVQSTKPSESMRPTLSPALDTAACLEVGDLELRQTPATLPMPSVKRSQRPTQAKVQARRG